MQCALCAEPIGGDPDALALICKNGHNDGVHDKCYKNRYSNEAYKWEIVTAADAPTHHCSSAKTCVAPSAAGAAWLRHGRRQYQRHACPTARAHPRRRGSQGLWRPKRTTANVRAPALRREWRAVGWSSWDGERSVGELAEFLNLRDSTVSQHLALLRKDGLVSARREAQTIFYSIASEPAREVLKTLYQAFCAPRSARTK